MGRLSVRALLFCALLSPALVPIASADPPKSGRARSATPKKSRAKPKKEPKRSSSAHEQRGVASRPETKDNAEKPASEGDGKGDSKGDGKALSEAQKLARDAAQGANAQIVKEGDTSVKVMQFTGLDIEGRLKSPQLLYFVSRVHAEFDRPKLPHRSFMPELERSTAEEPIR
jgi:hypothetical protein